MLHVKLFSIAPDEVLKDKTYMGEVPNDKKYQYPDNGIFEQIYYAKYPNTGAYCPSEIQS